MFTLSFPISLPDENTFFDNGQYPVPPLPGGLSFGCFDYETGPLYLQIAGFSTEQEALDFCPTLRCALRIASLDAQHSIMPSNAAPTTSDQKHFEGAIPTVTPTQTKSLPYLSKSSMRTGQHISILSKSLSHALSHGKVAKLAASPELALALDLYSDRHFVGQRNAQFVVLMTALEVLVPNAKGKRGAVVAFVKSTLSKGGHPDPKAVGKRLDDLYVARNALLHGAKSVTDSELMALESTVRSTLRALIV